MTNISERRHRLLSLLTAAFLSAAVLAGTSLPVSAASAEVWDGKPIDVSWYNTTDTEFHISTPAQLAGLAAIVNGSYNSDITDVIGDASCIVNNASDNDTEGSNNLSSDIYHYGADDFNGKTVYLDADIDMGGRYDASTDTWSGPNYMPVGGQYLMEKNDSSTKLSASFNGTFDGQGHIVANIYCDRHCSNGNYGDGSSVGLIGRLGCHDGDDVSMRADTPTVRNVVITGYIHANRSVGGIVGKIGKTNEGALIENCANLASVSNTDAKGLGGICGAAWNGGIIRNCYNAGEISSTYGCPTGGIAGSNEIALENCYNVGTISAARDSYAMAIGTNNGGGTSVDRCYYLEGSAPGGGYYGRINGTVTEMTSSEMQNASFVSTLGSAFVADTNRINGGYPILAFQAGTTIPEPGTPDSGSTAPGTPSTVEGYSDVSSSAWYYSGVKYVTDHGLFDAVSDSVFGPDRPMTRQMLVTALYRLAGSPAAAATGQFTDVAASASYAPAVAWASSNGIVNGVSSDRFAPDDSITREQIAALFLRYAQYTGADTTVTADLSGYTDAATVSAYATDAVRWCVGTGLINGMTPSTIAPKGTATRAQVAVLVERFAEYVEQ